MHGSEHAANSSTNRAESVNACADDALSFDALGRICWSDQEVARLVRGRAIGEPGLRLALLNLPAPLRKTLGERVRAWTVAQIGQLVAPLTAVASATDSAAVRGLASVLADRLGTMPVPAGGLVLARSELEICMMHEIRIGRWSIHHRGLTTSAARNLRWLFVRAFCELGAAEQPNRTYYSAEHLLAPALEYMGYCAIGDYWVRGDLAEHWLTDARAADPRMARALRCPPDVARILKDEVNERSRDHAGQLTSSLPHGTGA